MYEFMFYNPVKTFFGIENIKALPGEIKKYGRTVLLIYSRSFSNTDYFSDLVLLIREADIQTVLFGISTKNPTTVLVDKIAEICCNSHAEVILAAGGGTVIDCAKMAAAVSGSGIPSSDLLYRKCNVTGALPVIAIPTTAATGSEMNCGGLISNPEKKEKISFGAPIMFPKAAFIVPDYTCSLSPEYTAAGCADIMSHILENTYFTFGPKMRMNAAVQESIMRSLVLSSLAALKNPYDLEARADICWIASWALNGFLENGTGRTPICHAIEHQLSGYYDIPHAQGMAIILPKWLRFIISDDTADIIASFGSKVFDGVLSPSTCEKSPDVVISKTNIEEAIRAVNSLEYWLYEKLNLPFSLSEYHITDEYFAEMAHKICNGRTLSGLKNVGEKDIETILRACL